MGDLSENEMGTETSGWNNNISSPGYSDQAFQEEYGEDYAEELEDQKYEQGLSESDLTGYSEPKPLGGIYALFNEVLNKPSSIKVSNVNPKTELGDVGISVREALKIGVLADTFKHPVFARFFYNLAGITTDSAMSKDGWFTELFVTSKKYSQKASQASISNLPQNRSKKWKTFNKQQATPDQY